MERGLFEVLPAALRKAAGIDLAVLKAYVSKVAARAPISAIQAIGRRTSP
jgi:hypothetical protein